MSETAIMTPSPQSEEFEHLMQDKKVSEAFLLALFYGELLTDNPLVQKRLFLFVEDYLSVATSLATSEVKDLSSICIQEAELDTFFLDLWNAGLYGNPSSHKEKM